MEGDDGGEVEGDDNEVDVDNSEQPIVGSAPEADNAQPNMPLMNQQPVGHSNYFDPTLAESAKLHQANGFPGMASSALATQAFLPQAFPPHAFPPQAFPPHVFPPQAFPSHNPIQQLHLDEALRMAPPMIAPHA